MNIKIFGGSGFIGRHLTKRLSSLGHHVTVLDMRKSRIREVNVYRADSGEGSWVNPVRFVPCDITNYQDVYYNVDAGDFVINIAAIANFGPAEEDPQIAIKVNVAGAANVIKAAIENKAAKVVYTSTGSVYSKDSAIPIDEGQPTEQGSIYGMSKYWAERIQCHYEEKVPLVILRLGHIVGSGKTWGANTFIAKLLDNERPIIFGDGTAKNEFTHVDDVVQAIELSITKEVTGCFNIGTGISRSTLDFFNIARRLTDKMHIEPVYGPARGVDFPNFQYDISRAQSVLGYKPKFDLEQAIEKTVREWYQWL